MSKDAAGGGGLVGFGNPGHDPMHDYSRGVASAADTFRADQGLAGGSTLGGSDQFSGITHIFPPPDSAAAAAAAAMRSSRVGGDAFRFGPPIAQPAALGPNLVLAAGPAGRGGARMVDTAALSGGRRADHFQGLPGGGAGGLMGALPDPCGQRFNGSSGELHGLMGSGLAGGPGHAPLFLSHFADHPLLASAQRLNGSGGLNPNQHVGVEQQLFLQQQALLIAQQIGAQRQAAAEAGGGGSAGGSQSGAGGRRSHEQARFSPLVQVRPPRATMRYAAQRSAYPNGWSANPIHHGIVRNALQRRGSDSASRLVLLSLAVAMCALRVDGVRRCFATTWCSRAARRWWSTRSPPAENIHPLSTIARRDTNAQPSCSSGLQSPPSPSPASRAH